MGNNKDIPRIYSAHHEIHEGDSFTAFNDELTMQTTETINFAFKTPAATTKEIHMIIEYETLVGGYLEILEGAIWTAQSGTAYTPMNRHRNSDKESELLGDETTTVFTANEIAYDVTTIGTTNATTIHMDRAPGAQNKKANASRGTEEFILKAETTYVIRFTAVGNTNSGFIRLNWYEYTANII